MEMTKKLLLATVITSMFATNGFAMENNQLQVNQEVKTPTEQTEQTEQSFYEENETAILSAAAILGAVAVVTGGYFGYKYYGKDLCAKLFSKNTPKETATIVKTTLWEKTKNVGNKTKEAVKSGYKKTVSVIKDFFTTPAPAESTKKPA